MSYLALVRHGESEWNAMDLWTGWTDVSLSPKGHRQNQIAGRLLCAINFDVAFVSTLKRSVETLEDIKKTLKIEKIETHASAAINERDYGNFAGLNKIEVEEKYGRDLFDKWHRGWAYPLPHGETLKDVYARVVPYYKTTILPHLKANKNVLVSAHGNSLRALVKYLENIPDDQIAFLEIVTGEVYLYQIDPEGKIVEKQVLKPKVSTNS